MIFNYQQLGGSVDDEEKLQVKVAEDDKYVTVTHIVNVTLPEALSDLRAVRECGKTASTPGRGGESTC